MSYQVIFYGDERGNKPVQEFIDSLSLKTQSKILKFVRLLKEQGPFLRRPFADKLVGKLYELRVRFSSDNIRIIYYFFLGDKIILLHAFRKKDWAINVEDIKLSERRMKDFINHYEKGKIEVQKFKFDQDPHV